MMTIAVVLFWVAQSLGAQEMREGTGWGEQFLHFFYKNSCVRIRDRYVYAPVLYELNEKKPEETVDKSMTCNKIDAGNRKRVCGGCQKLAVKKVKESF